MSIDAGADDTKPEVDGGDLFECRRCGAVVPNEDAVVLRRSKKLWKPLCPDCFQAVGTPQGYELIRDLTHLKSRS